MIEVNHTALSNITPLFNGWNDVMILSCLQGHLGQAYANKKDAPTVAKIEVLGVCYAVGDTGSPDAKTLLHQLPSHMELQVQGEAWHNLVKRELSEKTHTFTRYEFEKDPSMFDTVKLQAYAAQLSSDYTLAAIDAEMFLACKS